jgi:hypothetical protein
MGSNHIEVLFYDNLSLKYQELASLMIGGVGDNSLPFRIPSLSRLMARHMGSLRQAGASYGKE